MQKTICLMAFSIFLGCQKEFPEPDDKNLIGGYTSFSLETRYLSHSGNQLYIETDIGFIYGGEGYDDTDVPDSVFKDMSFASNNVSVTAIESVNLTESQPYSNLILLDLAGDWNQYDAFNAKTRALNKSIIDGKSNPANEIAIGSFARNGYHSEPLNIWVYDTCSNPYKETTENLGKIVYDKYWEYGGTSNFYDALDAAIDNCIFFANHPNRNITVLVHEYPDAENLILSDDIITKAKANNITINLLLLNNNYDWEMARIALQTGGFIQMVTSTSVKTLILADVVDEGAPMMASMDKLLSRNLHVYRISLKLTKTLGNWQPGNTAYDAYQTLERYGDGTIKVNNYIPFYVTIP